jgi:trans-2,3-dihydro-3-hydroxyanthranilate isomerase
MTRYAFTLTDVFTRTPLAGNPLAVFADAAELDAGRMQAIAREFGHSETTFVVPARRAEAAWRLRCFTPKTEIFGAGHNALGAWWVLASGGRVALERAEPVTVVHQELGDEVLPVQIRQRDGRVESVSMTQGAPVFGGIASDLAELAGALGLSRDEIGIAGLEPQAVSTGARHLLVPVRSLAALATIEVEAERLMRVVRPLGCEGAYAFTLDTVEPSSLAHARSFSPGIGIVEDPATGTAAGPLAALLAARGRLHEGAVAIVEQGDEMGRPSRIEVQVVGGRVQVGGPCVVVAEGVLTL